MNAPVIGSAILALLLYLNTLPADFAYDDSRAIVKNPDITPESDILNIFYDDFWGTPLTHSGSHKSYRPLCVLTFRLNYAIHQLAPLGYHLGNVLLHALITATFTHTASLLLRARLATAIAGGLFAAHPIHTEAVAGVVGRADLLACLFFLLTFLVYMRYCKHRDRWKHLHNAPGPPNYKRWLYLVAVAVFTASAMLSKEQGVTILAICAVYDVLIQHRIKPSQIFAILKREYRSLQEGLLSLALIGTGLIAIRLYMMGSEPPEFAPADNPASDSESLLTRTLTYHYLLVCNAWIILFPSQLSFDWSMDAIPLIESLSDFRNLATILFYVCLIYTCFIIIRHLESSPSSSLSTSFNHKVHSESHDHRHSYKGYSPHLHVHKSRHSSSHSHTDSPQNSSDEESTKTVPSSDQTFNIIIVSSSLIIFPFIPATNLFFYVGFVLAERVLYIPSMGVCLLVAHGAELVYSNFSHSRSLRWRCHTITIAMLTLITAFSLRTVLRNQDWLTEESLYRAGITVNPAKAWGNLGSILNGQGKLAEAEEAYRSALQYRGNMADVHYNLGILLQEQKRYSEAIDSYKMAIKCRPKLTMAYLNLGIVYGLVGMKDEAEQMYRQCTEVDVTGLKDPRLHDNTKISALYNLGRLYADQDRHQEAITTYLEAVQRRPSHYAPQSLFNMLGEAYGKVNMLKEAEHWYREALSAKSDHIPAHLTMAKLCQRKGDYREAEEWFIKALLLDQQKESVYQHYAQFLGDVGRHEEAAEYYMKASELNSEDFELIFNTANALRQANHNIEAEEFYRRAANMKPEVATAHMNLGAMLHFNGKLAEAEQSYLTALKWKPDDLVTQNNLSKLRSLMNKKAGRPDNR